MSVTATVEPLSAPRAKAEAEEPLPSMTTDISGIAPSASRLHDEPLYIYRNPTDRKGVADVRERVKGLFGHGQGQGQGQEVPYGPSDAGFDTGFLADNMGMADAAEDPVQYAMDQWARISMRNAPATGVYMKDEDAGIVPDSHEAVPPRPLPLREYPKARGGAQAEGFRDPSSRQCAHAHGRHSATQSGGVEFGQGAGRGEAALPSFLLSCAPDSEEFGLAARSRPKREFGAPGGGWVQGRHSHSSSPQENLAAGVHGGSDVQQGALEVPGQTFFSEDKGHRHIIVQEWPQTHPGLLTGN